MKKKLITGIVVVALACFGVAALAGCGGGQSSSQSSDKSSDSKTTLIVGFDSAYPPYGFVGDDGQYTGFDLDLAQEVANRNGWDYKAEPVDWDAKD
ncbi:MAG: transporter substrate-binding domain-containing protein, partial [Coriobacteriaceae bacterium]|nr:transporter substrate-binding domain-containing protein [Coriobacteriaceae bacterium]